jgi:putative phosphoesterase
MKYLVASDLHGRLRAAERFENLIKEEAPDKILFLGDFLYNGPRNGVPDDYDPLKVSEILKKYKNMMVAIRGNCDSRVDAMLLEMKFEDSVPLTINGYKAHLIHGDLIDDELCKVYPGEMLLFGHTHYYMLEKKDGVIFLNPGSLGFPKGGNPASYAIIENNYIEVRRLDDRSAILHFDFSR